MNNFDWKQLFNPEFYITLQLDGVQIGLFVVLFIVFAETGLFAGFFLPGDSLLFLSGIYSDQLMACLHDTGNSFINLVILTALVSAAGILGNIFGYWFGKKSGDFLYERPDSMLFKKKYLYQAHDYYEKHGALAIVFSRFLPVLRTFSPIIAGIVHMSRRKFMFYNVVGSVAWSFSLIFGGHYLQATLMKYFGFDMKTHIEAIVIGIVLVTTLPVIYKLVFGKATDRSSEGEQQS